MSGELVGVGVVATGGAGVAVAGAFFAVAGGCLLAGAAGAYALSVVGRGAIRLGMDAYKAIDDQVNEHVEREMRLHRERLKRHFAQPLAWSQPAIPTPAHHPAAAPTVGAGDPFAELKKRIAARKKEEADKRFPATVSAELEEHLNKIEEMRNALHKAMTLPPAPSATGKKKATEPPKLRQEITHLAGLAQPLYPDEAEHARRVAANTHASLSALIVQKNMLTEKIAAMKKHGDKFDELAKVKGLFDTDPALVSALPSKDKQQFQERFERVRAAIEVSGTGDIAQLKRFREELAAKAKSLHDQKMFDDGVALFEEAMRNAGYRVSKTTSAREIVLHGTDQNGVETRISLGTPESNPDGAVRMNMEVDIHKTLTTPQGDRTRCQEAMDRLQREIDRVGLQVKIDDRTIRQGKNLIPEKAPEVIKKTLTERGVSDQVNVKVLHGNTIQVNGMTMDFQSSDPVDAIAARIQSELGSKSKGSGVGEEEWEKDRLRERS